MNIMKNKYSYTALIALTCAFGCKKILSIDNPTNQTSTENVFNMDSKATSALIDIYIRMAEEGSGRFTSQSALLSGLYSDELEAPPINGNSPTAGFSETRLQSNNPLLTPFWSESYFCLYQVNSVIEGLEKSTMLSTQLKMQIQGEAKFLRAYLLFELSNYFGDIPLVTSTDRNINQIISRSSRTDVLNFVIKDLKDAEQLLPSDFSFSGGIRIRATKWAASALIARAYLYNRDWVNAESESTKLISSPLFKLEDNLLNVFLLTSTESIWQLKPVVDPYFDTFEAQFFILEVAPGTEQVFLRSSLLNAFESGDKRRFDWVGNTPDGNWSYPYKYKLKGQVNETEASSILRLAEQYLIRAEARIQRGNIEGGITDLNALRSKRRASPTATVPNPLPEISALITKEEALLKVFQERRVELFCEYGQRWFDLTRSGRAITELKTVKPQISQKDLLFPVPQTERELNPNLSQNMGY
ncbi:MAG TPA: RagB/SusD family nutrient uptake outer membrane protein [Pedobacter sp.]|nr:RagB/SusD family nutrient uptake outer membrane protein [Pedobacter sp.]